MKQKKIIKTRLSFILTLSLLVGLVCVNLTSSALSQNQDNKWDTFTPNSKSQFYYDYDVHNKKTEIGNEQTPYSLAIKSSGNDTPNYTMNYKVEPNKNYVISAYVKTTQVSSGKIHFTYDISPRINNSIDPPETENNTDWKEVSMGFNSGNNTSVTIKLQANFTTAGTLWLDNVRIDKTEPHKVAAVLFGNLNAVGNNKTNTGFVNYKGTLLPEYKTLAAQYMSLFDEEIAEFSKNKILTDSDVYIIEEPIASINSEGGAYTVTYQYVKEALAKQGVAISDYDAVFTGIPSPVDSNAKQPYAGIYLGTYDSNGNTINTLEELPGSTAFINWNWHTFDNNKLLNASNVCKMDGLIHEFSHYLGKKGEWYGNCCAIDFPSIDAFEKGVVYDGYGTLVTIRGYVDYNNYYRAITNNINGSQMIYKKQWYVDLFNDNVPSLTTLTGTSGYRSLWIMKHGYETDYLMKANCGIEEGVYFLKTRYAVKYLDCHSFSTIYPQQKVGNYSASQQWHFKFSNGYYEIIPISDQTKRLTLPATADGTDVTQIAANGSDNQKWSVLQLDNGSFRIIPKNDSNKTLEIEGPSKNNGAKAQVWSYSPGAAQMEWLFEKNQTIANGVYTLNISGSVNCLDSSASTPALAAPTKLDKQQWQFTYSEGYYEIAPISDPSKRLTANNVNSDGTEVVQSAANGADSQKWIVILLNEGNYRIIPKLNTSKTLESRGNCNVGSIAQIFGYSTGGPNQKWKISNNKTLETGIHKLRVQGTTSNLTGNTKTMIPEMAPADNSSRTQDWLFEYTDGYYEIIPVWNNNLRLTAEYPNNDGGVVSQKLRDNSDNQKWIVTQLNNGKYFIMPKSNTSKLLETAGNSSDGKTTQTWGYINGGGSNQIWTIDSMSAFSQGIYTLRIFGASNYYLDADKSPLQLNTGNSQLSQQWEFKLTTDGYYEIFPLSDTSQRLTAHLVYNDESRVFISKSTGSEYQKWSVIKSSNNDFWIIVPKLNPSKVAEIRGSSSLNNPVQLYGYTTGGSNQKWVFTSQSNTSAVYKVKNYNTSKYLDASNNPPDQKITSTQTCQKWEFRFSGDYCEIIPLSNPATRLTAVHANIDGSAVTLRAANGTDNQKWSVISLGSGNYKIVSKLNPKTALDSSGGSTDVNTPIQLWTYGGYSNQKWILE